MKDKDLIKQLNTLKEIKPRSSWVKDNREVLLSQISGGTTNEKYGGYGFFKKLRFTFATLPQPAIAVFLIGAILIGSSVASIKAARDSKPGDSLYVAKLINEKAKFALTFSEEKKARLGLEFAGNRAEELRSVLSLNGEMEKERVAGLVEDFKKEISVARERLVKINKEKEIPMSTDEVLLDDAEVTEEEEQVMMFTAGTEKDEKGLQVSLQDEPIASNELEKEEGGIQDKEVSLSKEDDVASSSEAVASDEEGDDLIKNVENLANETEELLNNNEDIDAEDLSVLTDRADQITAQLDQGEVKGASSSEEVIEVESEEETASSTE